MKLFQEEGEHIQPAPFQPEVKILVLSTYERLPETIAITQDENDELKQLLEKNWGLEAVVLWQRQRKAGKALDTGQNLPRCSPWMCLLAQRNKISNLNSNSVETRSKATFQK